MNKNQPNNQEDQEIDLMQISKKIGSFFQNINTFLFNCIQFFVKNAIVISILLVIGVGVGFYLDVTKKIYNHQITVTPNFGSTDYLYSKIDLIESKIQEGDTVFLKEVLGVKKPKAIVKIEIKPVTDVYKFIENKTENFELIKLMAEDGDIKKVLEENLTSKNYKFHTITFQTKHIITEKSAIEPILHFLNESEYYSKVQKEIVNNVQLKMIQNDTIIAQINGVLSGFSNTAKGTKSNNLVYYNENIQLNDIIKTKESLINEQGFLRVDLVGLNRIVKENSSILNIENNTSINGKLKFILPILFVCIFILIRFFITFYRRQSVKANLTKL
ncbi:hypothetical protein [Flavobacterium sp. LB3P21]|uniref:hypothetical protein n=1 Tax=unclassified Flavobacterium TaxID=196869 RepID=UPI003AAF1491